MIAHLKSALILLGAAALLAGCEKIEWPHVYGPDEVPADVRDTPRPITSELPVPADTPYPRLGDVPSHPKDFTPAPAIDQTKQQMEDDRDQANDIKQRVQSTPSPTPSMPAPPAQ